MSRSTTVRVVNTTAAPMVLDNASIGAGRWAGSTPAAQLPAHGTATFVNAAVGRFGSARGNVRYTTGSAGTSTIELRWDNPFVGRNSYRMEVGTPALGVVCDGDDDDQQTTVTCTIITARKVTVPGFLPSTHGFRFTNSWTDDPLKRIDLKIGTVPIGKASNGLCGGMTFAVRDWFDARLPIPTMTDAPADRSMLREFVIERLIDSYDLPNGVIPYATLMSTRYPDDDGDILAAVGQVPSRASLLTRRMWPAVHSTIDSGHPCPLGLVMVASDDPGDMKHHHQVLAYAYQLRGTALTLWVYDPNSPGDDGITIAFDTGRTDRGVPVRHRVDVDGPLVCAFVPHYVAAMPPDLT